MSWATMLAGALGYRPDRKNFDTFTGKSGEERIRETLLLNPAIDGDRSIVNRLIAEGEVVHFRKRDRIIQEGAQDDAVYFLLAGEVNIVFKRRNATIRTSPNQVGEMAAMEPGKPRSASVVCRSSSAVTLKVSGMTFRDVWKTQPRFKERLQLEMSSRHRERILAAQVAKENSSVAWFSIAIGAGAVAGAIVWFSLSPLSWTTPARSIVSGSVALLGFLFTLLHNPAFFWRRCFGLVVFSMVGFNTLDQFISFDFQDGFGSLRIAISSGDPHSDWSTIFMQSLPFLIVLLICAAMEHFRSNKDE